MRAEGTTAPADRTPAWPLRLGRGVLLALLGTWLAWVVAVHVVLWTPLLKSAINAHGPAIHIDYRFAWSLWPGRVHARGLSLVGQDRKVQWQLDIDEVATTVVLTDLPRRIFHSRQVRVRGVSFSARFRVPAPEAKAKPALLEGLPPIAGHPSALAEEGPNPDIPDWRYKLFSIWLEDIDGRDVRRVWIDRTRLENAPRVAGAFYFKPIREVFVAPGELWLDGATLSHGQVLVADKMSGHLQLKLGKFDPRNITWPVLARTVDLDADLGARLTGLEVLAGLLGKKARLEGGAGSLRLVARAQAGELLPGTALSVALGRARLDAGDAAARLGSATLSLTVKPAAQARSTLAVLELSDLAGGTAAEPKAARVQRLRIALEGRPPDLANPELPEFATLEVRGGRLDQPRALVQLAAPGLAEELRVDRGTGTFSASLAGPLDRLVGQVRLALAGVQVRGSGLTIRGDAALVAQVRAFDLRRGADLSGTSLTVDHARLVEPDGSEDTARDWWARARLPRAQLRLGAAARDPEAPLFDGDLVSRCRDGRPIVGLYARRASLPGFVRGLFAMDDLGVTGSVLLGRGWLALRDLTAKGDHASVRATYRKQGAEKRGAALLTVRGLSVALGLGQGGTSIHLLAPGSWFADEEAALQPKAVIKPLARAPRRKRSRSASVLQTAE